MKALNLVPVLALAAAFAACSTQKSASSVAADDNNNAAPKKLITCEVDGDHGASTSFVVSADGAETGPMFDKAVGHLTVSGGIAHFIAIRDFQCTNRLAQPAFIGPNGPVVYDWACQSLALDGSGNVATAKDEIENVSIVTVGGVTTATVDAGIGAGQPMTCK